MMLVTNSLFCFDSQCYYRESASLKSRDEKILDLEEQVVVLPFVTRIHESIFSNNDFSIFILDGNNRLET